MTTFAIASLPLLAATASLVLTALLYLKYRHPLLGGYLLIQALVLGAYATEPTFAFLSVAEAAGPPPRMVVGYIYTAALVVLALAVPRFCSILVAKPSGVVRRVTYVASVVAVVALGVILAGTEVQVLMVMADTLFYGSWVYGVLLVRASLADLPQPLERAVRALYRLLLVFVPFFLLETVLELLEATATLDALVPFSPSFAVFVLVWNSLNIEFARRAFFRPGGGGLDALESRTAAEFGLTPAEVAVARLVLEGRGNKEIAYERRVTERTVKNQVSVIYRKTGTNNRIGLANLFRALED